MSRNLEDACSVLQMVVPRIQKEWLLEGSGTELRPIQVMRTLEEQQAIYAQGRTTAGLVVTHMDGVQRISRHQKQVLHGEDASHAVDLGIFDSGTGIYLFDDSTDVEAHDEYIHMARMVNNNGLKSGKLWGDLDHMQCIPIENPDIKLI